MMIARAKKRPNTNFIFHWKKLLQFILFISLVALCYFGFDKSKQTIYFPIKHVKVFGIHHADREQMQGMLEPLVKKGFFGLDVDHIKDRLQQSPWVTKVIVQRVWPDKVLIKLEEKVPLARWNKSSLLSTKGELFAPDESDFPQNIPQIIGPEGEHIHLMQYFKKINSLLVPLHFKIVRLELTPSMSWNFTFDNGMKISAGYKDVLTHIGHFVKVYPKIVGDRAADVEYVDLRYPNGLAIRWKSVT